MRQDQEFKAAQTAANQLTHKCLHIYASGINPTASADVHDFDPAPHLPGGQHTYRETCTESVPRDPEPELYASGITPVRSTGIPVRTSGKHISWRTSRSSCRCDGQSRAHLSDAALAG
jgi:hypothetical protein